MIHELQLVVLPEEYVSQEILHQKIRRCFKHP